MGKPPPNFPPRANLTFDLGGNFNCARDLAAFLVKLLAAATINRHYLQAEFAGLFRVLLRSYTWYH